MADEEYQPLKGDPAHVSSYGARYQQIGDAIARSVTVLNHIAQGDAGTSKAVDALKKKAGDVAGDIDKAKARYQTTAAALIVYGPKLDQAQQDATRAIAQIAEKQQAVNTAQTTATNAQNAADTAKDADKADAKTKAATAASNLTEANTDLATAQTAWHTAENDKNTAAQNAINAIHDVIYGSHAIKDSWWDNWGSKAFGIFKAICKWASILSVFLSWVPILGEVLLALTVIGSLIDVIDSFVNVFTGNGSWWGVLGSVAGLALAVVGGGMAGRLAKSFRSVSFLKVEPTVGRTLAGRTKLARILGKDAEKVFTRGVSHLSRTGVKRLVVKEGENVLTKSNAKDELLKATKGELEKTLGVGPKEDDAIDSLAKLKSDGLKQVFKEGIIPDLRHPVQFVKTQAGLGGTYDNLARGVRLIALDPRAVASDPKAVLHLVAAGGLAGAYQGYESYKAVSGHVENMVQGKWGDEGLSLFEGADGIKTVWDNASSMEFKMNG